MNYLWLGFYILGISLSYKIEPLTKKQRFIMIITILSFMASGYFLPH